VVPSVTRTLSLLLALGVSCIAAGETKGPPPNPTALHDGSPAPGPFVVVSPRYGRDPYGCFLTNIKTGVITVRMLGGEERQEIASEIASIRFNPEDMPPPPPHERRGPGGPLPRDGLRDGPREGRDGRDGPRDGPPRNEFGDGPPPRDGRPPRDGPPPRDDGPDAMRGPGPGPKGDGPRFNFRPLNGKGRPSDATQRRMKELQDKEQNEKLTDGEADELRRLREDGPLFPATTPRWWRVATARSAARQAAKTGKLDAHIESMQTRIQNADTVADATDALIMLGHAYIQRDGPVFTEIIKKVQTDIGSIKNERVRQDLKDHPPELMEVLREQKNNAAEPAPKTEPATKN